MKKLTLILCLLFAPMPALFTACGTAPAARQVQVHTLLAVGQTAKTAMDAAAQALKQGAITVPQFQRIATMYDTQFQPAYALAITAVKSDLSSIASPDLVALAAQLAALVTQLSTHN